MVKQQGEIIRIAAELLMHIPLSYDQDDYTFKVPKHHLNKIYRQTDDLRLIAIKLRKIADSLV